MFKILLAEDSKFIRLATERALMRAGYSVTSVGDGDQVIPTAKERRPDLILLDMLLPKKTGPEVLKALKCDPSTKEIPVIAFTGLSQRNAAKLEADGAFAFLEKSELELEKGSEKLLSALAALIKQLPAERARATEAGH